MKKYLLAIAASLVIGLGPASADDKKLSREDFDLAGRVQKVEVDVSDLKKRLSDLDKKFDALLAEKSKPAAAPAPRESCKCPTCPCPVRPRAGDCPGCCPMTYDQVRAKVAAGGRATLAIGKDFAEQGDGWVESLPGLAPGLYDCFPLNGAPHMQARPAFSAPPQACPNGTCPLRKS